MHYLDLWCENQVNFHCLQSVRINLLQHGLHESCSSREYPPTQWGSPGTAVWIPSPAWGLFRGCRTPSLPPETPQEPQGHLCWGTQSTSSPPTAFPSGLKEPFITLFLSPDITPAVLSATKTLTPALNTIIYFPSTWDQNCLKTYFTFFALDYVTEKFISHKFQIM